MKKILLITALLLIAGISANAQYGFGVKTGASISNMSIDNLDNRWGINTGILGRYKFGETAFAMQTEVLFNIQGAAYQANFLGQNIAKGKYELMYITVPMLMQFYIIPGLNVEFGPQFGFLTSAKIKPNSGDDIKVKDDMKTFDFSIAMSAAYELPMIPIGVYARYSLGLTDIYDTRPVGFSDNGKNRLFQFGVFVKF